MANKTENRRVNIYINGKEIENSGKAIRAEFMKARNELNKTNKAAADYSQKLKRFKEADAALKKHNRELRGVNRSWQQFKNMTGAFLGANLIQGALSKLSAFVQKTVQQNALLSDSYADVMKTTGLTKSEVNELNEELEGLNTRTSRMELLKLAEQAGRLGITGKDNIKKFVAETNMINVALGDVLGDGAALQIGKFASAFNMSMNEVGSAVNELGASTKAQEGFLVDFAARMQGTGVSAGISASEILGYGATLDELGLKVEMSGTAMNTVLLDLLKNTSDFEQAAGMANGELSKIIGEKGTNEGFLAFIERLKEANPQQDQFLKKLEQVGINGARGSQVFLAISNNLDKVRKNQQIANKAMDEGTSLSDEYAIKNNNLAAKLEKVQKWLEGIFVNGAMMKGAERLVGLFAKWVEVPLSEQIEEENVSLRALELQINNANTPAEQRIELIKELQEKYPDYLSNIDAETVSNEELAAAIDKVSASLVEKAMLQAIQEDIDERAAGIAENQLQKMEQEAELRKELIRLAEENNIKIDDSLSLIEQAEQMSKTLKEDESFIDKLMLADSKALDANIRAIQIADDLIQSSTASLDDLLTKQQSFGGGPTKTEGPAVPGAPSLGGDTEGQQKALKKKHDAFLKAQSKMYKDLDDLMVANIENEQEREIEKATLKYERRQEEIAKSVADEKLKNEVLAQEKIAFENRIDEINADFEQKREEEKIERDELKAEEMLLVQEALLTEREMELMQVEAHFNQLIGLAKKHGLDAAAVEEEKRKKLAAINKKYADAEQDQIDRSLMQQVDAQLLKMQYLGEFSKATAQSMANLVNTLGQGAMMAADFNKAMALFQIGIDTAIAISGASAAAAKAAAAAPPGMGVLASAATYAGIVAQVTGNMAQAKQILSQQNRPNASGQIRRFGLGGLMDGPLHSSPSGGMPVVNPNNGNVEAVVEGGEAILSRSTVSNNADVVGALLQSSMYEGGRAINIPASALDFQPSVNFDSFEDGGIMDEDGTAAAGASVDNMLLMEVYKMLKRGVNVSLTRMKDAEDELTDLEILSGKKLN